MKIRTSFVSNSSSSSFIVELPHSKLSRFVFCKTKDINLLVKVNDLSKFEGKKIWGDDLVYKGKPIDLIVTDGIRELVSEQVSPQQIKFVDKGTKIRERYLAKPAITPELEAPASKAEALPADLRIENIPENLTVEVTVMEAKTGKLAKEQSPARLAVAENEARIKKYQ